ncbi:MAG: hypothetical protein ACR2J1_10160 [Methyloceanibacter sp.]|uniref:hypothetical protein n=1 Tax=Methyloceanibacter sp. TaxID=1965321 RepID=UPI003D9BF6C8
MAALRILPVLPLLVLGLALQHRPAGAADGLAAAVKAADAKYLTVPDITAVSDAPKIEAGGWENEGAVPEPREISQGAVKAALSYRETTSEGETLLTPIVTISVDGKEVAKLGDEDVAFPDPPVSVQIAELDPDNPHPEVVVSFYTGGAHCCSNTSVVTSSKDGTVWSTVDVGQFDGGPLIAVDLDADGRHEFETRDNAFLYAFSCYACSEAPLEILALESGAVKDVSTEPSFKPAHEAWLKSMIGNAPDEDVNGFLAGYVGEKILLGEGKEAWTLMLAHYDKASDWGLEQCDQPMDDQGECPGKLAVLTFPDALQRMLKENGYKVEK